MLSRKKLRIISLVCSLMALYLGILVMTSWYAHNKTLIQVVPQFAPMQFNTAFGMFAAGLGLFALVFRYLLLALSCGFVITLVGSLTLVQYIFGLDLGIDRLLVEPYVTTKTSHPGRMAPNTALCFLLYGLAIILLSNFFFVVSKTNFMAELLGFLVLSVGLMAVVGYIQGVDAAYGWAQFTRMAIHTAVGFVVLAIGMIAYIWNEKNLTQHLGAPVLLLLVVLSLDLYMPRGASMGVLYVALIFYSLWFGQPRTPYILALISTFLIILGYYASIPGNVEASSVYTNRALSIVAVWITAFVIASYKNAQQQVEEGRRFLDLVINKIPEAVFVKNKSSHVIMANDHFWKRYPQQDDKAQSAQPVKSTFTPESLQVALEKEQQAFDEGASETREIVLLANGEKRTFFTKRIRFWNKKAVYILGVSTDITDLQLAFEEIMHSNEELARFAYIASHDLQEPLRMIANFTTLLKEEYGDRLQGDGRQYMTFIVDSANRMQELVADLLDYSRVGAEDMRFETFPGRVMVDSALSNLKVIIDSIQAVITIDELPIVRANPTQFTQLFQNLIGNALKYSDPNRTSEIHIGATQQNGCWIFSVCDNGIGIKKEYFDQIFVVFSRLHHNRDYKGTGIGLAICKKIVENHKGRIWLESEPGKGSCFYFTIPIKH